MSVHQGPPASTGSHRPCRVLVADHDPGFVSGMSRLLGRHGHEAQCVSTGEEAVRSAAHTSWDVVLLDLGLPDLSGPDVLGQLRALDPDCDVIFVDGGSAARPARPPARDAAPEAHTELAALRAGAQGYVSRPASPEQVLLAVEQAFQRHSLRRRVLLSMRDAPEAVGASPAWTAALDALAARAPGTPVLLLGEPGTGKRLAASLIHHWSERAREPFVTLNAGTLSPPRLEDALFGHAAGRPEEGDQAPADTGVDEHPGLLELASGGTVFVDAIDELSPALQAALVRLLDGHPAHRVGAAREIPIDVRLVAATHRDLAEAVRAGRFRGDLYQHLNAAPVTLPALRDRGEDVALLAHHFTATLAAEVGKPHTVLSPEALQALRAYPWPGNVRELRNVIERAVLLCDGTVKLGDLPSPIKDATAGEPARLDVPPRLVRLEDVIRRHVLAIYSETRANVTRSALALGISRVALRRRLREYGVKPQPL